MERFELQELFEMHLEDGVNLLAIVLEDNSTVNLNTEKYVVAFKENDLFFGGNGVGVTVEYRVIKDLRPMFKGTCK